MVSVLVISGVVGFVLPLFPIWLVDAYAKSRIHKTNMVFEMWVDYRCFVMRYFG